MRKKRLLAMFRCLLTDNKGFKKLLIIKKTGYPPYKFVFPLPLTEKDGTFPRIVFQRVGRTKKGTILYREIGPEIEITRILLGEQDKRR